MKIEVKKTCQYFIKC